MKAWKDWLMRKLTIADLVGYFNSIGIGIDMTFKKKRLPIYYAKNSRIFKEGNNG